jgi:hypothetical protein
MTSLLVRLCVLGVLAGGLLWASGHCGALAERLLAPVLVSV